MKCPKCGSEHIQFATKTSGGGFSFGNSCCGYILLGPLGLLCGACGSGTSTKEFWICQDCGAKFSNEAAKQKQTQENTDNAKFSQYTAELSAIQDTEGTPEVIRHRFSEISQRNRAAKEREDAFWEDAKKNSDPTMVKLAKSGSLALKLSGILFLLAIPALLLDTAELPIILVIGALASLLIWHEQTGNARKRMMEYSQEFSAIAFEVDTTKAEVERLKKIVEKIDFVERHQS